MKNKKRKPLLGKPDFKMLTYLLLIFFNSMYLTRRVIKYINIPNQYTTSDLIFNIVNAAVIGVCVVLVMRPKIRT